MENREYRLKGVIAGILAKYNYVLIDCAPSLDLLTLNALAASDSVLVPIQCEFLALEGVAELIDTLMRLRRSINPALAIEGILLTMYDDRTTLSKPGRRRPAQLLRRTSLRNRHSQERSPGRSSQPRHARNVLRHT